MSRRPARRKVAMLAGLGAALSACGPDASPPEPGVLFHREDPRFELRLDELPLDVTETRHLSTRVTPRGDWHLSTAYPVTLELAGTSLQLSQGSHTRDDAFELTEQAMEFRVAFEPDPGGSGRISGTLHFGICLSSELCEPVAETFAAEIP